MEVFCRTAIWKLLALSAAVGFDAVIANTYGGLEEN